jgi:hypothetical protein
MPRQYTGLIGFSTMNLLSSWKGYVLATSKLSVSSTLTVPSSMDCLRNSIMERTSCCFFSDMVTVKRNFESKQYQTKVENESFSTSSLTTAMFFCAISGEPPQEPVVSTKSKKVYERRLILKYIKENGTDPTTGDKLEESDLISIEASRSTSCMLPSTYRN